MDEIVSVLIFVVIVAISILGRIKSERKASRDRQDEAQGPPVAPEDLPEPLRRMLFGEGEGDVIIAKPKEPQQRVQPPEQAREVQPAPVPARQVVIERPTVAPEISRSYRREQAPPATPARAPQRMRQTETQRRQPPQTVRAQGRPQPKPSKTVQTPARDKVSKSGGVPLRPASRRGLPSLLRSRSGLAQGILLREILGRPRAFDI